MRLLIATILFLSQLTGFSQEVFAEPAEPVTSFRFVQLTGGVILLQGKFDTFSRQLNFILDTGSGGISLDSTTAVSFGLQPTASQRTIRGIAGIRQVSFLYDRTLQLPGMSVDSLDFHVNNYDILTTVYGEKIDGIIGYSLFSRYIVKINYDSTRIEFWTPGSMKYPRGGYLMKPNLTSSLPVIDGRIRDAHRIDTRFLFDLGAGLNIMLSTDFIRDSSLLKRKRKLYNKQAEGLGGKIDLYVTVVREVKLGPYKFRNVPAEIFEDEYNITSYPYLGGIVGNDLLRRFNVIINYPQREFYLLPNSHFNDAFDYSYSGVTLYYIDGVIMVGNVSEGSPAEAAGVKEGDIVVAINKDFSQNLSSLKASLQMTGQATRMIVSRKGNLMEFKFRIKKIF